MSALPAKSELLIYEAENGAIKLEVRFEGETVWLSQQLMADLFQTTQQNVSLHLQNIYEEGELGRSATHKEFLSVRREGQRDVQRTLDLYNLDAIISVDYRVRSRVATQFRIWATQRLREYIVKGFVLDDERLKNPDVPFDTNLRRWGNGDVEVGLTSLDELPYVMGLVRQSYERQMGDGGQA